MPAKPKATQKYVHHHNDGTVWAKGQTIDGVATGAWEWFRKDGTRLRSGSFENGEQVGEWTTYDRAGSVLKVTKMKAKGAAKSTSKSRRMPEPKSPKSSKSKGGEIDRYLAKLSDEQRAALETLRKRIVAAAPKAEECISYQLPAFRLDGKVLVLFGARPGFCTFFPGSGTAVAAHARELAGFSTSKGAIRFGPKAPPSAALVRKIVKYRIAENATRVRRR